MLCISAVYAGMRFLSVCLSVTFMSGAKTNKAILVFPYETGWRYFNGNPPPNRGVECKGGLKK